MRPNIQISHTLNGQIKDYAARNGLSTEDAYAEILTAGLDVLIEREQRARNNTDELETAIRELDWSAVEVDKRDDRVSAVAATYRYLDEHGTGQRSEFIKHVYPEYEAGLSESMWWRAVSEVLRQLDDVENPPKGGYEWTIGDE